MADDSRIEGTTGDRQLDQDLSRILALSAVHTERVKAAITELQNAGYGAMQADRMAAIGLAVALEIELQILETRASSDAGSAVRACARGIADQIIRSNADGGRDGERGQS